MGRDDVGRLRLRAVPGLEHLVLQPAGERHDSLLTLVGGEKLRGLRPVRFPLLHHLLAEALPLLLHPGLERLERGGELLVRKPRRGAKDGIGEPLRQRGKVKRGLLGPEVGGDLTADAEAEGIAERPLRRVEGSLTRQRQRLGGGALCRRRPRLGGGLRGRHEGGKRHGDSRDGPPPLPCDPAPP